LLLLPSWKRLHCLLWWLPCWVMDNPQKFLYRLKAQGGGPVHLF
jgi:hypothetical protein